jgi:hypothetical protein
MHLKEKEHYSVIFYNMEYSLQKKKTNYFYKVDENFMFSLYEWFYFKQVKKIDSSLFQSNPVTLSQKIFAVFLNQKKKKKKLEHIFPAGSYLKIQLRFIDKILYQLKYIILT